MLLHENASTVVQPRKPDHEERLFTIVDMLEPLKGFDDNHKLTFIPTRLTPRPTGPNDAGETSYNSATCSEPACLELVGMIQKFFEGEERPHQLYPAAARRLVSLEGLE